MLLLFLEVILYICASMLYCNSNMCLGPVLIGSNSVNAGVDFVHRQFLFHCFFWLGCLFWFIFLMCVNKYVYTTQKTYTSKFNFDPDFNFEKSNSDVGWYTGLNTISSVVMRELVLFLCSLSSFRI